MEQTNYLEGYMIVPKGEKYKRVDFVPIAMTEVMAHVFMRGITSILRSFNLGHHIQCDKDDLTNEFTYTWCNVDSKEIYAVIKVRQ